MTPETHNKVRTASTKIVAHFDGILAELRFLEKTISINLAIPLFALHAFAEGMAQIFNTAVPGYGEECAKDTVDRFLKEKNIKVQEDK